LRRIAISLVVVVVVAGTTAGGLAGAFGDLGRSVVSVTGRTLAEPGMSRSVVELDDGSFGSELKPAHVAQPLSVASPTTEPSVNEETGEARQLNEPLDDAAEVGDSLPTAPTANDRSAPPTSKLRDVEFQGGSADSAGKLISHVTVPKRALVQLATAAEPTPVPGPSPTDATRSGIPSIFGQPTFPNTPSTATPTTAVPTTAARTTAAPTTAARTTAAPTTAAPTTAAPTTAAPTTRPPATTAAPASAKTVRVSTNGTATGAGFNNTPVEDALKRARAGMVFEFAAGEHKALHLSGVNGASGNPIVLTAADRNNRPIFTDNSYTKRAAIEVSGSSNVSMSYLDARRSMWGVRIEGSSGIVVEAVRVTDIGQEGIRVTQRSSWVTIRNSVISSTGRRSGTASDGQSYSLFGEGIYLGSGQDSSDEVHHVVISGNDISGTGTEAIDVKRPVHDVEITNNVIHDIRTGTSGAVVVHANKDYSASSPNIRIRNNRISNITTSSGHRDGVAIVVGSSVDIVGNTISNTAHYGVRIEDAGSKGSSITVNIRDNSFSSVGMDAIWQSGGKAKVNSSNNAGA
jgi:hypothetical protein